MTRPGTVKVPNNLLIGNIVKKLKQLTELFRFVEFKAYFVKRRS